MTTRFTILLLVVGVVRQTDGAENIQADVCIYGATPAGIVAAVAAKQEGCTVVLIEPSRWVGGILGAGIKPMQDCPEPRAVGGLTKTKVFTAGNDPPTIRDEFRTVAEGRADPGGLRAPRVSRGKGGTAHRAATPGVSRRPMNSACPRRPPRPDRGRSSKRKSSSTPATKAM